MTTEDPFDTEDAFDSSESVAAPLNFELRETLCTSSVRDAVFECFPEASENTPQGRFTLNMLNHLLSFARIDEKTGGKIIPCQLVALLDGKEWDSNYKASARLDEFTALFAKAGGDCYITGYSHTEGQARTIRVDKWPKEIHDALVRSGYLDACPEEIYKAQKKKVSFLTGIKPSRRKQKAARDTFEQEALAASLNTPDGSMQRVVSVLLNGQIIKHQSLFRSTLSEGLPALQVWLKNELATPAQTPAKGYYREYMISLIEDLCEPSWYYRGSDKTPRLSAVGPNLHLLIRGARKALLGHLTTLDLKSSQLAIAARRWEATEVLKVLEAEKNVWQYLLDSYGLSEDCKPYLKRAIYACVFGMAKDKLVHELAESLQSVLYSQAEALATAKAFIGGELMRDLLTARQREMDKIVRDGGVRLPDWEWGGVVSPGDWMPLQPLQGRSQGEFNHDVRSLLACSMQAAEMHVMLPALEVVHKHQRANKTDDIVIISFLHDGMTVWFADKSRAKALTLEMTRAVDNRCDELGYLTKLQAE